jgi:hypothetical protein
MTSLEPKNHPRLEKKLWRNLTNLEDFINFIIILDIKYLFLLFYAGEILENILIGATAANQKWKVIYSIF